MHEQSASDQFAEVVRRALHALPSAHASARRAVYEKARAAVASQLRAARPALPAREIARTRLALEEAIARVEMSADDIVEPSSLSRSA